MMTDELEQRRERFRRRLARELGLQQSSTVRSVWHVIGDPTSTVTVDLEGLQTDEHFEKYFQRIKERFHW